MTGPKLDDQTLLEGANLGVSADDDLDSIMQELESMEAEVSASPEAKPDEAGVEEVVSEASASTEAPVANIRSVKKTRSSVASAAPATQALTMELTGSLNLKLNFATGNRTVELVCTDDALICRFGDGTEVRIPTDTARSTPLRRSA